MSYNKREIMLRVLHVYLKSTGLMIEKLTNYSIRKGTTLKNSGTEYYVRFKIYFS